LMGFIVNRCLVIYFFFEDPRIISLLGEGAEHSWKNIKR